MYSDLGFLQHIKEEVDFILSATKGRTQNEVIDDAVLCRAVVRSLEIIGEAAKKIGPDFKLQYPQIEWRKLAGTRDKLIHDYFGVDYEVVWNIIETKLPVLQEVIETILTNGTAH